MQYILKTALFFLLCNINICIIAQTPTDSAALRALQVGHILPPERVYLHFDNTAYYLGETIWFKAFVTSHSSDAPTGLSRVLYVELVSPEGYVVGTYKYRIGDDGTCYGDIDLNPQYLSGYYEIRAYTRYMLNWGDDAAFSRVIPVFDEVTNGDWGFRNMVDRRRVFGDYEEIEAGSRECCLNFYPESGHPVDGIETKVAYELRGRQGKDIYEEISIFANDELLLKTTPQHLGKGVFTFTPDKDVEYYATVVAEDDDNDRKRFRFDLPQIEDKGAVINVSHKNDSIEFKISNNIADSCSIGFAIIHRNNLGFYLSVDNETDYIAVNKQEIPEGVSRAILFHGQTPLAERLFFVKHDTLQAGDHGYVRLRVKTNGYDNSSFEAKPHERISITVEREDCLPIDENMVFSVAVNERESHLETSWGYNMYSYLLLGSELKGYIPDAWQYFDPGNEKREEHLDLIMLTHGWTAYDWSLLTADNLNDIVEPEEGITIRGIFYNRVYKKILGITNLDRINIVPYNPVRFDFTNNNNVIESTVFRTDSLGRFTLQVEDFYGRKFAALSPKTLFMHGDRVNYTFYIDKYFSPEPKQLSHYEISQDRNIPDVGRATTDSLRRTGIYEYLLTDVAVSAEKRDLNYYVPPISELRLDYLDEWEYATDVTYIYGIRSVNRLGDYRAIFENTIVDNDPETIIVYDGMDSNLLRDELYQYRDVLTARDVVESINVRYNLLGTNWTQFLVTKNGYFKDSIPEVDNKYLYGINVEKMTNFNEVVLTSDRKKCRTIENTKARYEFQRMAIANKEKYRLFYYGFLSMVATHQARGGSEEYIRRLGLLYGDRFNLGYKTGQIKYPNRIAYFIPHTRRDTISGIVPDLSVSSSTRRYTSVRGYNTSKQFYAPDYSAMCPDSCAADYRRTLLWNPTARAADGKITVDFYNNSQSRAFVVDVTGYSGGNVFGTGNQIPNMVAQENETNNTFMPERSFGTEPVKDSTFWAQCDHEFSIAEIYYNQKRFGKALTTYIELVKFGYANAYLRIGEFYLKGIMLKQNAEFAATFFTKGAELGSAGCRFELSQLLRDGNGVPMNRKEEVYQLQIAANSGHTHALTRLGEYYLNGTVVEKDSLEAARLLRKAAILADSIALYKYARLMIDADIPCDSILGTPLECITAAAEKQEQNAMLWLVEYEDKRENYRCAYIYAKELYMMGNVDATMYIAGCYRYGRGVERDRQLAKELYREAAAAGNEEAARILEEW